MSTSGDRFPTTTAIAARIANAVLSVAFLAAIFLPAVARLAGWDKAGANTEQRILAPMPALPRSLGAVPSFLATFDRYWSDQFGFRAELVRTYSRLMVQGFRTSSSSQVLVGRDGWLFYTGDGNLEDWRSCARLSESELAVIAQRLEERQALVESMGGHYLFVIVPNKESVYPDHMPAWAQRRQMPKRMDQILDYVRSHTRVDVLDLRPALVAARAQGDVYYRTDTHWNERGAYVAYGAIMDRLRQWQPDLQDFPADRVAWQRDGWYKGDLARLLTMQEELREPLTVINLLPPPDLHREELALSRAEMVGRGAYVRCTGTNALAPSLFAFHDSYWGFMTSYLPATFSRTWFKWQPAFEDRILRELRPTFVVHEATERFLLPALRENPPGISGEDRDLRAEFEASADRPLVLTNAASLSALRVGSQARLTPAGDGMQVEATGPDPYLYLPGFKLKEARVPVVHVVITSPVHTDCRIFYAQRGRHDLAMASRYLAEGTNDLLIALGGASGAGALRFDPAETSGIYLLQTLEVRTVPVDALERSRPR